MAIASSERAITFTSAAAATPMPLRPQRLFVAEHGSGPTLVMLHGLGSSWRYWQPHLDTLGRHYRMLMPDLLGFGRSPQPRDGSFLKADHIAALLASLEPLLTKRALLVGHSMGATVALNLVTARPDLFRGVMFVALPALGDCVWGHEDNVQGRVHRLTAHTTPGRRLMSTGMALARPFWDRAGPRLRPWVPRGATIDAMHSSWDAYWQTLEDVVYGSNVEELYQRLTLPSALLHGQRDLVIPTTNARRLAALRPDIPYHEDTEAGHNLPFSHPTRFYASLLDLDQRSTLARSP